MVRRAAERQGGASTNETREELTEPELVLPGEPPSEEVLIGIVVRELRLKARNGRRQRPEGCDRATKLQRIGAILYVVNRDVLAARRGKAAVACLRLRPGH